MHAPSAVAPAAGRSPVHFPLVDDLGLLVSDELPRGPLFKAVRAMEKIAVDVPCAIVPPVQARLVSWILMVALRGRGHEVALRVAFDHQHDVAKHGGVLQLFHGGLLAARDAEGVRELSLEEHGGEVSVQEQALFICGQLLCQVEALLSIEQEVQQLLPKDTIRPLLLELCWVVQSRTHNADDRSFGEVEHLEAFLCCEACHLERQPRARHSLHDHGLFVVPPPRALQLMAYVRPQKRGLAFSGHLEVGLLPCFVLRFINRERFVASSFCMSGGVGLPPLGINQFAVGNCLASIIIGGWRIHTRKSKGFMRGVIQLLRSRYQHKKYVKYGYSFGV